MGGEVSARAARGLISHGEIRAQESPQGVGASIVIRPPDEHLIYQSEMRLKGAGGGHAEGHVPDSSLMAS